MGRDVDIDYAPLVPLYEEMAEDYWKDACNARYAQAADWFERLSWLYLLLLEEIKWESS